MLELFSSTRFSVNSSDHYGRSRNGSLRAVSLSSFLFVFSAFVGSGDGVSFLMLLRVDAGRNVGITVSCGSDAGDVGPAELEKPVEKPGTPIGT